MIIPFKPWHAVSLGPRDIEWGPEMAARLQTAYAGGEAVTVLNDKRQIIACFGMLFVTRKTVEVWVLASEKVKNHARLLCRCALWCVEEAHRRHGVSRFQAAIPKEKKQARKWAEFLGFIADDSELDGFGDNGETYIRYVRRV